MLALSLAGFFFASTSVAFAAGSSHTEPNVAQPMPSFLDTQWIIFKYVKYQDGFLTQCSSWTQTCEDKHYTPQQAIDMKLGKNNEYEPVGISPYMDGYGSQIGVILYYRKKDLSKTK
jgi:hypothetical protein